MRALYLAAVLLTGTLLHAQTESSSGGAATGLTPPTRMLQCESQDDSCAQPDAHYTVTWTFDGTDGAAKTPGVVSGTRLTIEQFDGQNIVVRRFDKSGATAGMTGLYTGKIEGKQISGTVKWSWMGHPGYPTTGYWSAVLPDAPETTGAAAGSGGSGADWGPGIPPILLECEGSGPCSGAWTFSPASPGAGNAIWYAQKNVRAKLTVVRFDPDDVFIRRTDTSDGMTAVYHGARHGAQISGTVIWSTPNHPGASSGVWSASMPDTVCDTQANLSPQDALRIGQFALMFHRQSDALGCYTVAANGGDVTAEMVVGMLYYQGKDSAVPQDFKQALYWFGKAANQGNYAAQRTLADMYMLGQGTNRDAELSHFYAAKADEQQRLRERQQDRADRAADRQSQMLSGFVMGAVFGALLFY